MPSAPRGPDRRDGKPRSGYWRRAAPSSASLAPIGGDIGGCQRLVERGETWSKPAPRRGDRQADAPSGWRCREGLEMFPDGIFEEAGQTDSKRRRSRLGLPKELVLEA